MHIARFFHRKRTRGSLGTRTEGHMLVARTPSRPLRYTYYLNGNQHSLVSVSKAAGCILADSSFTTAFTLSVEPNAKEGICRFRLQLSYRSARELRQISVSTMMGVSLWRSDPHLKDVSTVPTNIFLGSKQVQSIVTTINSDKGTANNLQLRLVLKPP